MRPVFGVQGVQRCSFGMRNCLTAHEKKEAKKANALLTGLQTIAQFAGQEIAVGQNQWYHFGVGPPPILVYFSGDWDVHWGYNLDFDPQPNQPAIPCSWNWNWNLSA